LTFFWRSAQGAKDALRYLVLSKALWNSDCNCSARRPGRQNPVGHFFCPLPESFFPQCRCAGSLISGLPVQGPEVREVASLQLRLMMLRVKTILKRGVVPLHGQRPGETGLAGSAQQLAHRAARDAATARTWRMRAPLREAPSGATEHAWENSRPWGVPPASRGGEAMVSAGSSLAVCRRRRSQGAPGEAWRLQRVRFRPRQGLATHRESSLGLVDGNATG